MKLRVTKVEKKIFIKNVLILPKPMYLFSLSYEKYFLSPAVDYAIAIVLSKNNGLGAIPHFFVRAAADYRPANTTVHGSLY